MKEDVTVTDHAAKRMCERPGLNKRSVQAMANKAYKKGIGQHDAPVPLRLWMGAQAAKKKRRVRPVVYGAYACLFNDTVLVTVLLIPRDLRPLVKKASGE